MLFRSNDPTTFHPLEIEDGHGDAIHPQLGHLLGIVGGVEKLDTHPIFLCPLLQDGLEHPARAAPRGTDIDDGRLHFCFPFLEQADDASEHLGTVHPISDGNRRVAAHPVVILDVPATISVVKSSLGMMSGSWEIP